MNIEIPDPLALRIKAFCEKNKIEMKEFIFDAIIEKLEGAHKEKRKRQRV